MKLGDNLTNPVALIDQLYANGAAAVVLFNRFYQPDINIENICLLYTSKDSTPEKLVFNRTVGLKDTWGKINK